jgi:hypothetical protein
MRRRRTRIHRATLAERRWQLVDVPHFDDPLNFLPRHEAELDRGDGPEQPIVSRSAPVCF